MTLRRLLVPAALVALLLLPGLADAQPIQRRARLDADLEAERAQNVLDLLGPEHLLREAHRTTTRYFYDPAKLREKNWDSFLPVYEERIAEADTPEEVYATVNEMLGELKTSHLVLVGRGVWARELANEFRNRASLRAGCELVEIDGRHFVDGLAEDGPAERAGLLEGDEVVRIDGAPTAQSSRLEGAGHDPGLPGHHGFSLRVDETPLALSVRRQAGAEPFDLTLTPTPMSLIESSRRSVRLVEVQGAEGKVKVGVVHLWHFIHMEIYRIARKAISRDLKDADALVLDIRGRGGSSMVVSAILGLFNGRRARWDKPVVCLTDGGTRSAKEIFAHRWKQRDIGPVVGERTQGACIGTRFVELTDGSVMALPMTDVRRLTRGVQLEGVGVAPTVPVDDAPLPYRGGKDTILEAGLRAAAKLVGPREPARVF